MVRPLTLTASISRLRRSPWQTGHGRIDRYGSSSSCSAQLPSSNRRRRFGSSPSNPFLPVAPTPESSASRALRGSFAKGMFRSMPCVRLSDWSASRTSLRSPRAHGAMAPSASDFVSSGTTRCGSKSTRAPRPWQPGHAPCGELNENARGVISGMLSPQSTHARRRENSRSPASSELMTTMSSARLRATSIDSISRRSTPPRTMTRSTSTSIAWLRRRSSLMSSSSDRNWPSIRALVKPRARSAASSFLNSPLRPRTTGARTLIRASCG